jgi:hypothetical protein
MNEARGALWFFLGATLALVGIRFWSTHRQLVLNAASGMVGKCRRCGRSYTFRHPSQWLSARRYHDSYDCNARKDDDA